jgi:hypothetical protein
MAIGMLPRFFTCVAELWGLKGGSVPNCDLAAKDVVKFAVHRGEFQPAALGGYRK